MGNPASSTRREESPSYVHACAMIFVGSLRASRNIVLRRDAWIDGIFPRTFCRVMFMFAFVPSWDPSGVALSNWKG